MIHFPAQGFVALVASCCALLGVAHATDPLPAKTQLVAASNAALTEYSTTGNLPISFTLSGPQDLVVTLNFLAVSATSTVPPSYGPPVSAGVVLTQAGAIAGSASLAAPATGATASIPAASGTYTLYVFGVPDANTGISVFSVCVAPKSSPSACIAQDASQNPVSFSGNIASQSTANDPTVTTLSTNITVSAAGAYTVTYGDLQFPAALHVVPTVALFQGGTLICPNPSGSGAACTAPAIASGTVLTLSPGQYQLLGIAQASQTIKAGLYGITIAGPSGTTPLLDTAVPVGLTTPGTLVSNPSAQSVTLKVSDYGFPGALASASALLTSGGTALGTASAAGGATSFMAPTGTLYLWTYGSAGATPGTFSADVAGGTDLATAAQAVQLPGSSTFAYAFVVTPSTPLTVGTTYQATATDLQFPSQLGGLSFTVAQNGVVLQPAATASAISFNATTSNPILLVGAQAPDTGSTATNGLFDVNLQTTGAAAQLLYDKTQSVSSTPTLFSSQSLTLGVNGSFDVNLNDLKFPAAFDTLALVVSRGSEVVGKIYGGGLFSFGGTPGTYQLTFVATPATQPTQQEFGLYGVSVVYSAPAVTLTSSVASAAANSPIVLNWTTTNATSCTASGGSFTGSQSIGTGSDTLVLAATTTYVLTCMGAGGSASQSVTVTATAAAATSHGGGGEFGVGFLAFGGVLVALRFRRRAYDAAYR